MGYRKRTVNKTGEITDEMSESVPESVSESVPEIDETQRGLSDYEDETARRKQEIADKRRASLALARSKIVPKSALKKQTDEVIKNKDIEIKNKQEETDAMRLKYERDRVKQLEDNLMTLQKLIAEKPVHVVAPVVEHVVEPPKRKQRPSRSKEALAVRAELMIDKHDVPSRQPQKIEPKKSIEPKITRTPTTETLIDKSYGEQLQERLRSQAINKIMNDTFGGF